MLSLRLTLLVVGIAVVVAIYLFGSGWKFKRRTRHGRLKQVAFRSRQRLASVLPTDDEPDVLAAQTDVADITPRSGGADDTPVSGLEAIVVAKDEEFRQLPSIRREPEDGIATRTGSHAQRTLQQMDLDLAGAEARAPAANAIPVLPGDLVVLYVKAAPQRKITGTALLAAMNQVGMKHGAMRIFHHHGIGGTQSDRPIFSVANMYEPGYFDLNDPQSLACGGLAMFLQLPAPCDGSVALELFLDTAQRLARLLDAQVLSQEHRALSAVDFDRLRGQAGEYPHVRPKR